MFVVIGTPKHLRKSYKLWEEPKGPDFVLEVVSESTWVVDRDEKPEPYASLEVGEYWLFDPTGEQYPPRLRGMRLEGGRYRSWRERHRAWAGGPCTVRCWGSTYGWIGAAR